MAEAAGPDRELNRHARLLVLGVCSLSLLMATLDNTIVNVALPVLQRQFHASVSELQWVADAYLLVLASMLLLAGSLGDRFGRRRVLRIGLTIFGLGSLACSLAPDLPFLIGARMLQACGGCMLNPNSLSIISNVFRDPKERAGAIGFWGGVVGIGTAAGPILGGGLIDAVDWRAIFWVNIPVVVTALVLLRLFVPESKADEPRRADPTGQVVAITVLAALTYAIIEGPSQGWGSPPILACSALAVGGAVAFVVWERRRDQPLLELGFFRSPPFSGATAIAVLAFVILAGWLFLNTLYLQEVRGYSPLLAGVVTLPATVVIAAVAPLTGRLVGRRGARLPLTFSGLALAVGTAMLVATTPHTPYLYLAGAYFAIGLGFGSVNPPITNSAVSGMPLARSGVASAIAGTARQVGSVLGVAVLGAIASSQVHARLGAHLSTADKAAFTSATHMAWALTCACGVVIAVVAYATTGPRAKEVAERVMEQETGAQEAGAARLRSQTA